MSRVFLTPEQLSLLQRNLGQQRPARKAGAPRVRRPKEEMPENVLEGQIGGFLKHSGWFLIRNHVGRFVPLGRLLALLETGPITKERLYKSGSIVTIGIKGDPDWLALRQHGRDGRLKTYDIFFWEAKAPGKKPSPEQTDRMKQLVDAAHLRAACFDNLAVFTSWYKERFR